MKSTTVFREAIEWCDVWIAHAHATSLPRVLFVGDSITRGYYPHVERALNDRIHPARLATSRFLTDPVFFQELQLVLDQFPFDLIHFNNGLHGWDYTEEDYAGGFEPLVRFLRARNPQARLLWAASTPLRVKEALDQIAPRNERVLARNRIAATAAAALGLPCNDLYAAVANRPDAYSPDGCHFNEVGQKLLADQVVQAVTSQLGLSQVG